MKVAILCSVSRWQETFDFLSQFDDIEPVGCVLPFDFPPDMGEGGHSYASGSIRIISVDESIQLYIDGKIDAIILSDVRNPDYGDFLVNMLIRKYKLSGVDNLILFLHYPAGSQFWAIRFYKLDPEKFFLNYLETHVTDGCNLNCKSCGHYASLFSRNDIYPLEEFRRDVRELSKKVDLALFRLMGGEPFLVKNLDEYLDIARSYFPNTQIALVSNGLLIPQTSDKVLNSIARNKIVVDVTQYPPTIKIRDKIIETLSSRGISLRFGREVKTFITGANTKANSDANKTIAVCGASTCRFLRAGKIYKCASDALSYQYEKKFPNVINFPPTMPADIYATNFLASLSYLVDNPVNICRVCLEKLKNIPWSVQNNPTAEDWL